VTKLLDAARAITPENVGHEHLSASVEVLLERYWGQMAGAELAKSKHITEETMRDFLDLGPGVFDWGALTATIRVA